MAPESVNTERIHNVESVSFTDTELVLVVDGETHRFPLKEVSHALADASASARRDYRISPSGYGIHWEELDEDLSIDGLLGIPHVPPDTGRLDSIVAEPPPSYPG
jgi:hypothetical protein